MECTCRHHNFDNIVYFNGSKDELDSEIDIYSTELAEKIKESGIKITEISGETVVETGK